MFSWFSNKEEQFKPLPLSQREKSYSAAGGQVYQYIFKGLAGRRHVFEVTTDRRNKFDLAIELPLEGLAACADRMGSPLRWNEEYAIVKLCLFEAFDSAESAEDLKRTVRPESAELLKHMSILNMG